MNNVNCAFNFFFLTFILTWICWIPAAFLSDFGILPTMFHYAGGMMPTLVTLYLLFRFSDNSERKGFWYRLVNLNQISIKWYLVIFLTVPFLMLISSGLDVILGGVGISQSTGLFHNPLLLLPFALFNLVFGPLPEEIAWRGYILDRLQFKWNALHASIILGIFWTIWHLPLFFIEGSYQNSLGIGTPLFWLYMLDKVPISILLTWIYNNTNKSIASAVLFHFMINFVGELFNLSLIGETIYISAWWFMAVIATIIWKPEKMMHTISH